MKQGPNFDQFHKRYYGKTYIEAKRHLNNDAQSAGTVTNEILWKVWEKKCHELEDCFQPIIWGFIRKCTYNASMDVHRAQKRTEERDNEVRMSNSDASIELELPKISPQAELKERLLSLTDEQKRYYKDLNKQEKRVLDYIIMEKTSEEIIGIMNISENHYNQLTFNIRKKFNIKLEDKPIRNDEDIGSE